ncbi:MAG: deoxycytidylate deaminase [Sedimentibacter sp.]|jgi:dCMP deaminase|nr:deoxycytidylate deaminase [Sedimentibacter sp.]
MEERISWDNYFLLISKVVSSRATCFSEPKGAVIVVNKNIVSTGYNGAPSGIKDCKYGYKECKKRSLGYGHGTGHHICLASHAEANAIDHAAKNGISINGGTLYCTHKPCSECAKHIINSGIIRVVYINEYESNAFELFNEAGIDCVKSKDFDLIEMLNQIK